ncbi:hypothetical protein Q6247_25260, partial [Klebsiella pneumoniae]
HLKVALLIKEHQQQLHHIGRTCEYYLTLPFRQGVVCLFFLAVCPFILFTVVVWLGWSFFPLFFVQSHLVIT